MNRVRFQRSPPALRTRRGAAFDPMADRAGGREPLLQRTSTATKPPPVRQVTGRSTVDETMPPTIGAAMRIITSEPVPLDHMSGSSPAMIATTVIMLGVPDAGAGVAIADVDQHVGREQRVLGRDSWRAVAQFDARQLSGRNHSGGARNEDLACGSSRSARG